MGFGIYDGLQTIAAVVLLAGRELFRVQHSIWAWSVGELGQLWGECPGCLLALLFQEAFSLLL